ncbi:hypothetical protein HCB17_17240 [Salinispora arenicola]|nr:hypothetical protein [Salinispora arenicola]
MGELMGEAAGESTGLARDQDDGLAGPANDLGEAIRAERDGGGGAVRVADRGVHDVTDAVHDDRNRGATLLVLCGAICVRRQEGSGADSVPITVVKQRDTRPVTSQRADDQRLARRAQNPVLTPDDRGEGHNRRMILPVAFRDCRLRCGVCLCGDTRGSGYVGNSRNLRGGGDVR